jgi:protocatechuate 3,4-dioxygenase beta subunit
VALGCAGSPLNPTEAAAATAAVTGDAGTCSVAPNETAGPYPSRTDLFRSDIREGRPGTTLALAVRVVDVNAGCAPVADANVEIWQCDATGNYSHYCSQTAQTYLRGIQTTGADGLASFTTVYPGWYQGRATHIHLEVVQGGRSIKVTQIAFPESISDAVHVQGAYAGRGANPTTNTRDGIFADSLASQLVTPVGSVAGGYEASFQVGVAL